MDLVSLVLTLRPLAEPAPDQPLPAWWGRAAHALLLKAIRARDENLAQDLHDESSVRPYTASNLLGPLRGGRLDPQAVYRLRFTGLSAAVSGILAESIRPGGPLAPGAAVELDYLGFRVEGATCDPAQDGWAAASGYSDLAASRLVSAEPAPRQVALELASPTQFHSNERTQPLPLPELVFGSLLERWNSYAPIAFPAELRRYAAECLAVNRFELRSRPVALKGGGKRIGAVGVVGYTALSYDRYWMSLVHTLAAFSLFSGVGAGVSMGLGQARIVS